MDHTLNVNLNINATGGGRARGSTGATRSSNGRGGSLGISDWMDSSHGGGFGKSEQKAYTAAGKGLDLMDKQLLGVNKQLSLFENISKMFNQQMYDTLRVLGISFKNIAGLRLFANVGKQIEGGSGAVSTGGGTGAGAAGAGAEAGMGMGAIAGAAGLGVMANFGAASKVYGAGFKAAGLDEGVGKATGIAAVLAGPLFPIAAGVGVIVAILKKMWDNSQVAAALTEGVNSTLGSIMDTFLMMFILLEDKFGLVATVVTVLQNLFALASDLGASWKEFKGEIWAKELEMFMTIKAPLDRIVDWFLNGDFFGSVKNTLTFINDNLKIMQTGLSVIGNTISAGFISFRDTFMTGLKTLSEWFTEGMRSVFAPIQPLSNNLGNMVTLYAGSLDKWTIAWDGLKSFLTGFQPALDTISKISTNLMNMSLDPASMITKKLAWADIYDTSKLPSLTDVIDITKKLKWSDILEKTTVEELGNSLLDEAKNLAGKAGDII